MTKRSKWERSLDVDDQALWDAVVKDVRPLKDRTHAGTAPISSGKSGKKARLHAQMMASTAPVLDAGSAASARQPSPSVGGIDRKRLRKLARGHMKIDSRLDLHGMTQDKAYRRLVQHLNAASVRGERCVLVITGKGGSRVPQLDAEPVEYRRRSSFRMGTGVLRRMVPLWLETPELRTIVHAYHPANITHGGDGALYVMVRRRD